MATSNYYSKDDEDAVASAGGAGGVLTGGGGDAPSSGPAAAGGSEGSGFVNLSKYLDANRGGSAQMAGALNADLGTQIGASNEALSGTTSAGVANAQSMDTTGIGVGTDISAEGEAAALGGIEQYGMSNATGGAYDAHGADQERLAAYGSNLQNDQSTRQEAVQRLYGSGRGSGFGGLDAFLVAGDKSSGFAGGVDSELGGMGDIEAGRSEVSGAFDTANAQRAANTTAQYQGARDAARERADIETAKAEFDAGVAQAQQTQSDSRDRYNINRNRGGFGGRSKSTSGYGQQAPAPAPVAPDPYDSLTTNKWDKSQMSDAEKSAEAEIIQGPYKKGDNSTDAEKVAKMKKYNEWLATQ